MVVDRSNEGRWPVLASAPFPLPLEPFSVLFSTPFMSDPRFARLRTDPRFRRPKKHQSKVVVDERFREIFEDDKTKGKKGALLCSTPTLSELTPNRSSGQVWTCHITLS
jgi:hypothetical protein